MEEEKLEAKVEEKQIVSNDNSITEDDGNGTIQISRQVMSSIVRKFTLDVPGVIRFQTQSLADSMLDILGKRSNDRSIVIDIDENGADITVTLIMEFGVCIPKVAHEVQATLRANLEGLTGMKVRKININVVDLEERKEEPVVEEAKDEEAAAPAQEEAPQA